jgi:selenocysteine-specific elongation factor
LLRALATVLAAAPARPDLGRPRLPIDRVFTIAGFGTIVTGTLLDGSLRVGDEVILLPGDLHARIRGLQTHKTKLDVAHPGSRVAVNLSGLHPDQIQRGQVLTLPGLLRPTLRVDVRLRALPGAPVVLAHNMEITFHSGAAETLAHLRLLEGDALAPGHSAWAQIELQHPLALARNDHFIIRRPSPSNTLGGGLIADPTPRRQHRRRQPQVFAHLETLLRGSPADLLEAAIGQQGPLTAAQAVAAARLPADQAPAILAGLMAEGRAQPLESGDPNSALITPAGWAALAGRLQDLLRAFHQSNPLRLGMPREEMKARVQPKSGWPAKVFSGVIARAVAEGAIVERSALLSLPAFSPRFSPAQQAAVDKLLASFRAAPYNSPSSKQCLEVVSEEVFEALLAQGILVRVAPDVVFERTTYETMVTGVRETILTRGQITVGDLRDLFDTSRKYALALLEHLDAIRITRREGDVRILR